MVGAVINWADKLRLLGVQSERHLPSKKFFPAIMSVRDGMSPLFLAQAFECRARAGMSQFKLPLHLF